jgi:hypothetical protein
MYPDMPPTAPPATFPPRIARPGISPSLKKILVFSKRCHYLYLCILKVWPNIRDISFAFFVNFVGRKIAKVKRDNIKQIQNFMKTVVQYIKENIFNFKILKFGIVGGSGVVVNMGLLYILTAYSKLPASLPSRCPSSPIFY